MLLKQGTLLGNRYEVLDRIGAGGMAIVYQAKDKKLERFVTLKVLREEFVTDDEFVSRFKSEAQSAGRLSHSNIVSVYDVGEDDDIYYIVMEYIDGDTLKDLITSKAPFDSQTTVGIAIQIAQALMHAHKNQLIHRDIKPQNILVRKDGAIKVTDFGIARAATSKTLATTGSAIGSVHYFSPEQARGGYVDQKSDIYSLGIVMYEMATGKLPFEGDNAVTIAIKQIKEEIPQLNKVVSNVSLSLQRIVEKAVAKRPEDRYDNIMQMHSDLKQALVDSSGNFVKKVDIIGSPTVKMTRDQMDQIRKDKSFDDIDEYTKPAYTKYVDESENNYDNNYSEHDDTKSEWKIILAAILTSIFIIAVITAIGLSLIFNSNKEEPVKEYVMLSLIGREFSEAQNFLIEKNVGIELSKKNEEFSDLYDEGRIIWQSAEVGEIVKEGSIVEVDISLGPDDIEVPNVVNMEESKALQEFDLLDLRLEKNYIYSERDPVGVVISQEPSGNTEVKPKTTVTLTISQGQELSKVIVPNVIGDTEADAKNKITAANLVVGQVTYAESETIVRGSVIQQTIAGGSEVNARSIVYLVVSSGPPVPTNTQPADTQPQQLPDDEEPVPEEPTTPSTPTAKTKSITITESQLPTDVPEDGVVTVKILKITGLWAETLYEKERSVSDFPVEIEISITEDCDIQLYINDALKWVNHETVGEDQ